MDYTQLSDYEINKAIALKLNPAATDFCKGEGESTWFTVSTYSENRDYCNNPSDAWPIITENKISIMWMTVEQQWCATALGELEEGCWEWSYCPDHYFNDDNPLKAVMVVFLMMQDKADANS